MLNPVEPVAARSRVEAPTIVLAILIYGSWLAVTYWHAVLPWPATALLGGAVIAWHGSLQHEAIHGHPTPNRWVNDAIGFAPLSLWLPYAIYRRSHLDHHGTTETTDPLHDPESHYVAADTGLSAVLTRAEATLVGRLLLGPPIRIGRFFVQELARAWRTPAASARDWVPHLAALLPIVAWLVWVGMPATTYLLAFVYSGTALSLLRSFAEHRADPDPWRRAVIVERPGLFGLLFLNNNLHAVHHAQPDFAWYRLPEHYHDYRSRFAAAPRYGSYGEIARRFAWTPQDDIVHPDHRAEGIVRQ